MDDKTEHQGAEIAPVSFFDRPGVEVSRIPVGAGVPIGIERVTNSAVGMGGAYGSWGDSVDNQKLQQVIADRLGEPLRPEETMDLTELGFVNRHHIGDFTPEEHLEIEVEVGARFLIEAARANGWDPSEVEGLVLGVSGPVVDDYTERIARRAGIPPSAIKASIHKACDGSVGGLHLALNSALAVNRRLPINLAEEFYGKKILVGGIEGLSRFIGQARDKNALQLFGNGAGVIGVVPGESMKFLVGHTAEVFDDEGVLQIVMCYPHSGQFAEGESKIEVSQAGQNHLRVAGFMHQPEDGAPIAMAGMMGMVKLFVRSGVNTVNEVYQAYQRRMAELNLPDRELAMAIVHHANFKINQLIEKHLQRVGFHTPMPWLLREFGNVSAASNMMAFLRKLRDMRPGDHILIDGFGAGTYYDALAVEMGG